jgi:hypothetical protein
MAGMGRKRTSESALSQLLLKFANESQDLLIRSFGQFSTGVKDKVCPMSKRVGVDWSTPQTTSTPDSGRKIV